VEWSTGYDACNAELYINRFTDVPVYLKCLDQGYGPDTANKIINALDKYFEVVVSKVLADKIMADAPDGFIYNFVSPYDSDRNYCAHGSYYTGGNLVDQAPDSDGVYITKFTYGFDMIWYKPKDFEKERLLPNVNTTISEAFDGSFLKFLQDEYPENDFIQDDNAVCNVIDPTDNIFTPFPTPGPSFPPTEPPTEPTCDVDSNAGCLEGQVCRKSCAWAGTDPECYDDEVERDCGIEYGATYGPGWSCLDVNGDGIIDALDHSQGCQQLEPTSSPTNEPTLSPMDPPTLSPSTLSPTISPSTSSPTISPSLRPVTLSPTVSYPPTKFIHPSSAPTDTPSPSSEPTPLPSSNTPSLDPTPFPSSSTPTLDPTAKPTVTSTYGDTTTGEDSHDSSNFLSLIPPIYHT